MELGKSILQEGIGGLLTHESGTILIFSVPSNDLNSVKIKLTTVLTMWHAWQAWRWRSRSLVICTDSQVLADDFVIYCANCNFNSFFFKTGPILWIC